MKKFRNILPCLPLAFGSAMLLGSTAQAQQITNYRYWFDDETANLVNVTITATPELNAGISLNSAALSPGYHTVTVQFKDNDAHWSAPWTSEFNQKGGTLVALQYWFNDDAGNASLLPVTPTADLDLSASLDAAALPVGLHLVTLRGKDERGEWSVPYTSLMTRGGGLITGYEYWIDDQVADRVTNTIGPAGVVDLISDLPLNTPAGDHTFTVRFHDEAGEWSVPITTTVSVYVGMDELPGVGSLTVFPNPVQDQLTLRLDALNPAEYEVGVLDLLGRTVAPAVQWNVQGLSQRNWDTRSLAAGQYIIRISSQGHTANIPFTKP